MSTILAGVIDLFLFFFYVSQIYLKSLEPDESENPTHMSINKWMDKQTV